MTVLTIHLSKHEKKQGTRSARRAGKRAVSIAVHTELRVRAAAALTANCDVVGGLLQTRWPSYIVDMCRPACTPSRVTRVGSEGKWVPPVAHVGRAPAVPSYHDVGTW